MAEHDRYAKEYQKKLDEFQAKKAPEKKSLIYSVLNTPTIT
jgi:hypothetical protein